MVASIEDTGARRVLVFGEVLVVLVQAEPGPLADCATFTRSLAGAEANVGVALAAHGLEVGMLTAVGADGFGRYATARLERLGVDIACVLTDPVHPTGLYVKEVGDGTRSAVNLGAGASAMHYYRQGSASSHLTPDVIARPEIAAALAAADLVHTTGITPALSTDAADTQRALVERARDSALVSFDVNWRAALWRGREDVGRAVLDGFARTADIVFVGRGEAETVFGTTDPERLRGLLPEPRRLIVKNDGGAATGYDGQERVDVAPGPVSVREAIGAGDAFAGGVLAGLLQSMTLAAAIAQGHGSAAAVLRGTGDQFADGGDR